jgi:acylphosphatase
MSRICRRYLVSGRVQGVWFRESSRRVATRLGLDGSAINLPDGRVEVIALGRGRDMEQFSAWLRQGPAMARVDGVVEESIEDPGLIGFITT